MKLPYNITSTLLNVIASIAEKIGEINVAHLNRLSPELRKESSEDHSSFP